MFSPTFSKTSSTSKKQILNLFNGNHLANFSVLLLLVIVLLAIAVPIASNHLYYEVDLLIKNQPPSLSHWFGTDDLGRDLFTRIWQGARISLFVGISAAIIDLFFGVIWGASAALAGGKIDEAMMRIVDILSTIPSLLIIIPLMVVIGPGLITIIIALSILGWITMARIVRGQLLKLREQGYVVAARALGAGFWRILFLHLLPNTAGPILVSLTFTISSAIFIEAFLSYLGLGVQAPVASWGTMASEGLPAMEYYPWRLGFPALLISMTLFAFNNIGDALNERFS